MKYLLGRSIESGGDANTESGYGATSGSSSAATRREKPKAQAKQSPKDLVISTLSSKACEVLDQQTILVNLIFQNKGDRTSESVFIMRLRLRRRG